MANKYTKTPNPSKEDLEDLYHKKVLTQTEIGVIYNVSQRIVFRWFRDLGINSRVAAKRDQRGSKNSSWKSKVTYAAYHYRAQAARGKANKCEVCNTIANRYEWANLTGKYEDVNDYKMMCTSCHHKFDGHRNNLPNRKQQPNINKRKIIDGITK